MKINYGIIANKIANKILSLKYIKKRININLFIIFDQCKYEIQGHYRTKLFVVIPHN